MRIRAVEDGDASAVATVYDHYVLRTIVTFEESAVSAAAMAERIERTAERHVFTSASNVRQAPAIIDP